MLFVTVSFIFVNIILLTFLWIRNRKRRMCLLRQYGIPGPTAHFFSGNLTEFAQKRNACIQEWLEKYGKIFGFYLGGKPFIICADVELLKLIQIKNFRNFVNRDRILPDIGIPHESAKNIIGLLKNEKWKNLRSIFSASLSSRKIKQISILVSDPINIFLKNIEKENQNSCDFNIKCKQLMFDISCKIFLGIDSNVQNEGNNKLLQSLNCLVASDITNYSSKSSVYFPELEPLPTYFRLVMDIVRSSMNLACGRKIFQIIKQIIALRKFPENKSFDILQTIIEEIHSKNKEEIFQNETIIPNIVTFMMAGYESIGDTLEWSINLLAYHPEIQEKVRQEINANVSRNKNIDYTDLAKLNYLDQVLSESLRLSPLPVLLVTRKCAEDFKYKDMIIPKGIAIVIPAAILHKNSEFWQEPEKFDPERFSPENRKKINPMSYQPFGAGPRMCIGYRLARTIMKLILTHLIRSFKLCIHGDKIKAIDKGCSLFSGFCTNRLLIKAVPTNYA